MDTCRAVAAAVLGDARDGGLMFPLAFY